MRGRMLKNSRRKLRAYNVFSGKCIINGVWSRAESTQVAKKILDLKNESFVYDSLEHFTQDCGQRDRSVAFYKKKVFVGFQ